MPSRYGGITGTEQIANDYQNINTAFEAVEADVDAKAAVMNNHINSTEAHTAEHITYSGSADGTNVKDAIDTIDERIDTIIQGGGPDKDAELVDIRTPDPSYTPQRTINVAGDMTRDMQAQFGAQLAEKADRSEVDTLSSAVSNKANQSDLTSLSSQYNNALNSRDGVYANAVINGNFDVWQRGSSFNSNGYSADRWYAELSQASVSRQSTGVPVGSRYCCRMSMTGTGFGNLFQAFESDICKKLAGKTVTITAKLRKNPSFNAEMNLVLQKNSTADTVSGGTWTDIQITPIPNASLPSGTGPEDWYTASVTATIPNDGTANGIRIWIQMSSAQAAGAYYEISQVSLIVSNIALPFLPRSYAEELFLSKRYYQTRSTNSVSQYDLSPSMRVNPTISGSGSPYGYDAEI